MGNIVITCGTGGRLFGETSEKTSMRLVGTRPIGESLAVWRRYAVPA